MSLRIDDFWIFSTLVSGPIALFKSRVRNVSKVWIVIRFFFIFIKGFRSYNSFLVWSHTVTLMELNNINQSLLNLNAILTKFNIVLASRIRNLLILRKLIWVVSDYSKFDVIVIARLYSALLTGPMVALDQSGPLAHYFQQNKYRLKILQLSLSVRRARPL